MNSERALHPLCLSCSATLPNLSDFGDWFECDSSAVHYFDQTYRPTPLRVHTLSMGAGSNQFLFEKSLDAKVKGIIDQYGDGKPVLIFCASKSSSEKLAGLLAQQFGRHLGRAAASVHHSHLP